MNYDVLANADVDAMYMACALYSSVALTAGVVVMANIYYSSVDRNKQLKRIADVLESRSGLEKEAEKN